MERIVVLGGYGAVGREAATALAEWCPGAVVVAGRDPAKARTVAGAASLRVDLSDDADLERALDGADAVLMCVERDNVRIARACVERGVHYVDVSASYDVLVAIETLDELAAEHSATAVLSVGLAPGVTNLLARHCAERSGGADVRIGVLVGMGERHGPASIEWTLDGFARVGPSSQMDFPQPYGTRTVHRFPFSDQQTLPGTLGVERVTTGMCLDSRALTTVLAAARRPVVTRLLSAPRVRAAASALLTRAHVGGDGFAVTVTSGAHTASFTGRRQSRATGLAAALVVRQLDALPAGVRHIDEVIEPVGFLTELAGHGFDLDLGAVHHEAE
ncbi:saccharopine dehydrogenase family protein [Actinomadura alba]|uniref:Saccharopine dehydrogenase NADP-binding domain-containing protein n=1 Tax=Actinomadura alba TaxID=406431 RepID=A0ABR7LN97_9ACTN|nr:saccharopine dehydrogenase NADP-binding domain-containing protein [Actinomadura alba]MBC6466226.1 saccharopine dehydrogenase NADP-binding domain-containing protein [Actinomadura alba]